MAGPGAVGMSFASGLLGVMGADFSTEAQAGAAQYQAGVARINEQIARQNADYSRHVGEIQAQEEGMKTAQVIGETKAKQAGSGVDLASGSAKAVTDTQLEVGQYDQALIRSSAAWKAYGHEVEATSEEAKAKMADATAENVRKAGPITKLASLVGAGSSIASKWMQGSSVFGKEG